VTPRRPPNSPSTLCTRPYLAFDSVLCEALQHNLSGLVPPPHHPSTLYPLPTVVFRMFDYTDCPEVSRSHRLI
jgi:hypothetical protein